MHGHYLETARPSDELHVLLATPHGIPQQKLPYSPCQQIKQCFSMDPVYPDSQQRYIPLHISNKTKDLKVCTVQRKLPWPHGELLHMGGLPSDNGYHMEQCKIQTSLECNNIHFFPNKSEHTVNPSPVWERNPTFHAAST